MPTLLNHMEVNEAYRISGPVLFRTLPSAPIVSIKVLDRGIDPDRAERFYVQAAYSDDPREPDGHEAIAAFAEWIDANAFGLFVSDLLGVPLFALEPIFDLFFTLSADCTFFTARHAGEVYLVPAEPDGDGQHLPSLTCGNEREDYRWGPSLSHLEYDEEEIAQLQALVDAVP